VRVKRSYTGEFLKPVLARGSRRGEEGAGGGGVRSSAELRRYSVIRSHRTLGVMTVLVTAIDAFAKK
jgi:hypothetical protein